MKYQPIIREEPGEMSTSAPPLMIKPMSENASILYSMIQRFGEITSGFCLIRVCRTSWTVLTSAWGFTVRLWAIHAAER